MLPADYCLGALTLVLMGMGVFRGLSGILAFVASTVIAAFVASFGWTLSAEFLTVAWQRILADSVATLIIFGVVKMIIKASVNGLLAQPTDAIMGGLVGLVAVGALIVAWALSGFMVEYSGLATYVAGYVAK